MQKIIHAKNIPTKRITEPIGRIFKCNKCILSLNTHFDPIMQKQRLRKIDILLPFLEGYDGQIVAGCVSMTYKNNLHNLLPNYYSLTITHSISEKK